LIRHNLDVLESGNSGDIRNYFSKVFFSKSPIGIPYLDHRTSEQVSE